MIHRDQLNDFYRLEEYKRLGRRSVADTFDTVQKFLHVEPSKAFIFVSPPLFSSPGAPSLIDLAFPEERCLVSLPSASEFKARYEERSKTELFEICLLEGAEARSDGSVSLRNGFRLRGFETIPFHFPYQPSALEQRILLHLIKLTEAHWCFRSLRHDLPENHQVHVPDLHLLDYSRVRDIQAPPLKQIKGYIEQNDASMKVSTQKIADALRIYGIRNPRPRPRRPSAATI